LISILRVCLVQPAATFALCAALLATGCSVAPIAAPTPEPKPPSTAAKPIAKPAPPAFSEPKPSTKPDVAKVEASAVEPAVVVAIEDILNAKEEADLWERIRKGFAMPELPTPLVAEKEKFYSSKPEYLQRMFTRGGRYLHHIVEEVEKRGLPTELALLPFVESAMNPVALSGAKAAGLWQFIPSTGKAYNLNQNWWVDNRRDVVQSTRAALDYLQKIYALHGNDWFLALASYNWGEGAVGRAVKKNVAAGRPTDYLNLDMPNETRHYIPKLIAIKNIISNAQQMGISLPALANKAYFVTIEKTRPIDLKLAAQFAGMSVDEFVALNPAHNRPVIAASKNNEIKIPADRLKGFVAAVEAHSDAQKVFASWQPHTIQTGETLDSIAAKGNVSVAELRKANGLRPESRIVAGTRLLAPQRSVSDESKVESFVAPRVYEQIDLAAGYHRVGKKETLSSIAGKYGVTVASLKVWNGIKVAKKGSSLIVRPPTTQTLLTTESGERSVVSNISKAIYKPVPEAPEPAKVEKVALKAEPKVKAKASEKAEKAKKPDTPSKSATKSVTKPATKPAVKSDKKANKSSEKSASTEKVKPKAAAKDKVEPKKEKR
jgi:membrane-bound lytic murein transglycosylase D